LNVPHCPEVEARRLPRDIKPSRIPLTIVCGPPGAGKSTYLRQHVGPDDIVIDLDQIKQEYSGLPEHAITHPELLPIALEERNKRLRTLCSDTTHKRAWFVVSAPNPEDRRVWADMLGGRVELIATPLEVCIERIKADPTRVGHKSRMVAAARAWWDAQVERRFGPDGDLVLVPRRCDPPPGGYL
jgi:predicted kinase